MGSFGSELRALSNIHPAFCRCGVLYERHVTLASLAKRPCTSFQRHPFRKGDGGGGGHDVAYFTAYHFDKKCRIVTLAIEQDRA